MDLAKNSDTKDKTIVLVDCTVFGLSLKIQFGLSLKIQFGLSLKIQFGLSLKINAEFAILRLA